MAPKWAYPMNGLGNFYVSKNNKTEALQYFFKAVKLDSLFGNAYRSIGMTYYNQKVFDSAKYYFRKAIALDSCDSYANENYGSANADYISPEFGSVYTDSIYFNISKKYFLKSISCDQNFAAGYLRLANLYSRAKKEDSARAILERCVVINPGNAEGFRNLGNYYLNTLQDTVKAQDYFNKAIALDPSTGDNYYSLARLYRKQKNRNKAIEVYAKALDQIGNNKDLFNEMGNTYFEAPSDFDKAIRFYNKALEIDSTTAYVYFNLGKLYGVKDTAKENSIEYYRKAVFFDPIRFQKTNHLIAEFYYNNKQFGEAKTFYRQSLAVPNSLRYWDTDRLVNILIAEKNFAEAENSIRQYLNPESDKDLYVKLIGILDQASGK